MKAHSRYLRSNPWESSRALGVILLTVCALFPTLVHAAAAEERPVEVSSEQKQAPPSEAKPEVKPVEKEAPLATKPSIQERSPKQAAKPIADPPMIRSLPTGENKTGVSSQSISVPKGPGTIEGMGESFSAQASTGIATFSVPFALPAARGDAQPSLALSYSSASGSGVAGVGWDVGVPFIARETDRGLPQYDLRQTNGLVLFDQYEGLTLWGREEYEAAAQNDAAALARTKGVMPICGEWPNVTGIQVEDDTVVFADLSASPASRTRTLASCPQEYVAKVIEAWEQDGALVGEEGRWQLG